MKDSSNKETIIHFSSVCYIFRFTILVFFTFRSPSKFTLSSRNILSVLTRIEYVRAVATLSENTSILNELADHSCAFSLLNLCTAF